MLVFLLAVTLCACGQNNKVDNNSELSAKEKEERAVKIAAEAAKNDKILKKQIEIDEAKGYVVNWDNPQRVEFKSYGKDAVPCYYVVFSYESGIMFCSVYVNATTLKVEFAGQLK